MVYRYKLVSVVVRGARRPNTGSTTTQWLLHILAAQTRVQDEHFSFFLSTRVPTRRDGNARRYAQAGGPVGGKLVCCKLRIYRDNNDTANMI